MSLTPAQAQHWITRIRNDVLIAMERMDRHQRGLLLIELDGLRELIANLIELEVRAEMPRAPKETSGG